MDENKKSIIKRIFVIIGMISILVGCYIVIGPLVRQTLYQHEANQVIEDFEQRDDTDDLWWLYDLIVKYNKELYESNQVDLSDPFSYEQVSFSLKEFGFDEELIGYLDIPQMNIRLPVYLGASQENMSKGAAHLSQTSIPIGGVNTNAVIAAHRGYDYNAVMFRDITNLEIGDVFTFTNYWETLSYKVVETKVIDPTDIDAILIQPGKDMMTLLTCHPYGFNYSRYIVYCERVINE